MAPWMHCSWSGQRIAEDLALLAAASSVLAAGRGRSVFQIWRLRCCCSMASMGSEIRPSLSASIALHRETAGHL